MATNVFEESTVRPRAWISRGDNPGGTATFVFYKDDAEVERKDAELAGAVPAFVEYVCPKVADDKENYHLRYEIETPYGTFKNQPDYIVWPKKITLHAVEESDGKDMKGCQFVVKQLGAADTDAKTLADGKIEVDLKAPKAFTVEVKPPFEIIAWDPAPPAGRNRKAKVVRHFTAVFLLPNKSKQTVKQFVNLVTAADGQDGLGEIVKFEVAVKEDQGKAEDAWIGRPNDKIYIEVKFSRTSKRNIPKPALTDALDIQPFPPPAPPPPPGSAPHAPPPRAETYRGHVLLGADGKATFKVNVGLAGGDITEVKVGSVNPASDDWIKFENWRRVFYELLYPDFMAPELSTSKSSKDNTDKKDLPALVRTKIGQRLGAANLEYKMWDAHEFPKAGASPGTVMDRSFLRRTGGRADRLVLGNGHIENPALDPAAFASTDLRCQSILLCDRAFASLGTIDTHQPESDAVIFEVPATPNSAYFEISLASGASTVVVSPGDEWEALVDPDDWRGQTTLTIDNAAAPDPLGSQDATVRLIETAPGTHTVDLLFHKPIIGHYHTDLGDVALAALDAFITQVLDNRDGLRKNPAGNNVSIHIVGQVNDAANPNSSARRLARFNNAKAKLIERFDVLKASIAIHPGLDATENRLMGPMDASWITFKNFRTLRVTLPTGAGDEPGNFVGPYGATKCTVALFFKIEQHFEINGAANSGRQVMVLGGSNDTCAGVFCHELGHNLGMTIMAGDSKVPPGMDPALHVDNGGTYYVNGTPDGVSGIRSSHVGPHCATGLADVTPDSFDGEPGTCIMFGESGDGLPQPNFCPTCTNYIKGRKLVDIRGPWDSRPDPDC